MKLVENGFKIWIETLEYMREADEDSWNFICRNQGRWKESDELIGFPFFPSWLVGVTNTTTILLLISCDFTRMHSSLSSRVLKI